MSSDHALYNYIYLDKHMSFVSIRTVFLFRFIQMGWERTSWARTQAHRQNMHNTVAKDGHRPTSFWSMRVIRTDSQCHFRRWCPPKNHGRPLSQIIHQHIMPHSTFRPSNFISLLLRNKPPAITINLLDVGLRKTNLPEQPLCPTTK